jgi:hypothetical protein
MDLAAVRDFAIIVLALESIVVGVILSLLLWQIRDLTRLLEEEIKPILDSARETAGTVKGTTALVSETIVSPTIKISGFVSGLRRVLEVLLTSKQQRKYPVEHHRSVKIAEEEERADEQ